MSKPIYSALQINLHLLLSENLTYPMALTSKVEFGTKRQVFSGKVISFNDYWYLFCSEDQNIYQIKLVYEQGMILNSIELRYEKLNMPDQIYFC